MAITVEPGTYIIHVPKDDLTLVQSDPTEIREMDLNWFRMQLRDWEDSEAGIVEPVTHNHNTEVVLGGITYARVIEILPPYTITFEDGQYAVNLVGANSNVGDRVNVNQVSIRSSNSAGLIFSDLLEYASFNGYVTYDEVNGVSGTLMPTGTEKQPVNNMRDAKLIAEYRGLFKGYIKGGGITLDGTEDVASFEFIGEGGDRTIITVLPEANVSNCVFRKAFVTGTLDGKSKLVQCAIGDLSYINGYVYECFLVGGTISLGGNRAAAFLNCWSDNSMPGTPVIDLGGSGQPLSMQNFVGEITLTNKTGPDYVMITLSEGCVYVDTATMTNGTLVVAGTGRVIDIVTGKDLVSGMYGNMEVQNHVISLSNIAGRVWSQNEAP